MQIPETPKNIEELDLMRKLRGYSEGLESWETNGTPLGSEVKRACRTLYDGVCQLVNKVFAPLLDRVTAREMETYTMHDRVHGLKVAHLMWHILRSDVREYLSPPEIALLVCSAHMHDIGMGLSRQERTTRLSSSSDLWNRLDLEPLTKSALKELQSQVGNPNVSESVRRGAERRLFEVEEALLTQDTRSRHATLDRYRKIVNAFVLMHESDPERLPDIRACLSFDGDSFLEQLLDICVSHNEDSEALVESDKAHSGRPRFRRDFPVGRCTVDLQMVAAALRLADILDFDRERTPPALFHYLLPGPLSDPQHDSGREWGKHLAISNWHIEDEAIVFRGRCNNHIIHHAIMQFASAIEREIVGTRTTFGALRDVSWPCSLPTLVRVDIYEEGYRYIPYRFELDDDRVFSLLMGGAIYENPLDALRELIQNAVDACKLRDALTCLYEPQAQPLTSERIFVRYEEPTQNCGQPILKVKDTGTGMDALILERFFLKVGRSYYVSSEFDQTRVSLRQRDLDFAPVSDFGIGFLSSFLLARRVEIETAMSESPRGDTTKRTLQIDGPTRLIKLSEERNEGPQRFKGTCVTLYLCQGAPSDRARPPSWQEVKAYLKDICQDLPYVVTLEHVLGDNIICEAIEPQAMSVALPAHLESVALRIPVDDRNSGIQGEVVLINPRSGRIAEEALAKNALARVAGTSTCLSAWGSHSDKTLLRGGFKIGPVPGLPSSFLVPSAAYARIRLTWKANENRRYAKTNLARTAAADMDKLRRSVVRQWLEYLLQHVNDLHDGQTLHLQFGRGSIGLESFTWLEEYDALRLFQLAANGWFPLLNERGISAEQIKDWKRGVGTPLWVGAFSDELHRALLDLILPKVTTLLMGPEKGFFVTPPKGDWQKTLIGWHGYISSPVPWGLFAEYVRGIEDLVFYDYPGTDYLNARYKDRLLQMQEHELRALINSFHKLADSLRSNRQAQLTTDEASLVRKAQEALGSAEIGSIHGRWHLESLKIPEVNSGT